MSKGKLMSSFLVDKPLYNKHVPENYSLKHCTEEWEGQLYHELHDVLTILRQHVESSNSAVTTMAHNHLAKVIKQHWRNDE